MPVKPYAGGWGPLAIGAFDSMNIHRTLPHSVEAEQGVLGSCMLDNNVLGGLVQQINDEYFYIPAHQTIYSTMVEIWSSGAKFDLLTLTQFLRDKNILETVGGASFITALYTFVPTAANIEYYQAIVRDKYILRQIIAACTESVRRSFDEQGEVNALLEEVQSKILSLSDEKPGETLTMKELAMEALEELEAAYENKGKIPGLETGLIDLDKKFGGMRPKQLIVIAADTGQGKTALGLNTVEYLAMEKKVPCGIISLEMSAVELTHRLIASVGKIDLHKFTVNGAVEADFPKLTRAIDMVAQAPIFIRDESDVDIVKLRAIGRQLKLDHDIQFLLCDYIQLGTMQAKDESPERATSRFAQALKQMSKELGIVTMALSQINENGKLRDSRAIGHHADKVATITHSEDEPGLAFLHINKNRGGPLGDVPVTWLPQFTRFTNKALQFDKR